MVIETEFKILEVIKSTTSYPFKHLKVDDTFKVRVLKTYGAARPKVRITTSKGHIHDTHLSNLESVVDRAFIVINTKAAL